jgi:hypothetical protein
MASCVALVVPLSVDAAQASTALPSGVDGDGYADLLVGAPEGVGGKGVRGGYVAVVPGGPGGVDTGAGSQVDQDSAGVPGAPEAGDRFGEVLRSADVDGDGHLDLAVSSSRQGEDEAGDVSVFSGSAEGLTPRPLNEPLTLEDSTEVIAAGDVNGDGYADVMAGVPGENTGNGAITLFYATADGLSGQGSLTFGGATLGLDGTSAEFGRGLSR